MKLMGYIERGGYWSRFPKEFAIILTDNSYDTVKSDTLISRPVYIGRKPNIEYFFQQSLGVEKGTFKFIRVKLDCEVGTEYMLNVMNEYLDCTKGRGIKIRVSEVDGQSVLVAMYKGKMAISKTPRGLAVKIQSWF